LFWGLCITTGLLVLALGAMWWLMIRMPGETYRGELPAPDDALIAIAGELRRDIGRLATEIGERNVSHRARQLAQAADYIEAEFQAAGYEVKRQWYPVGDCQCCNVEVAIAGATRRPEIVVVGAHYDSVVGTPGANDNASGVAAVLALARRFAVRKTDRTLRFVAFVNEEPPYFQTDQMGSWVYARRAKEQGENIVAMLSLETIGYYDDAPGSQQYPPPLGMLYPSRGDFIGIVGNTGSRDLVRRIVATFRQHEPFPCEGGAPPGAVPAVGFSDHWSFWQEGYAAAMVTDTAMLRYPHYHQPEDTADKVQVDRVARVVRGLEHVILALADTQ